DWVNARGAIPRFDRQTIEIRILDVQECPAADLAIHALIVTVLQALTDEHWSSHVQQQAWEIDALEPILHATIRDADQAIINNGSFLGMFGLKTREVCRAG